MTSKYVVLDAAAFEGVLLELEGDHVAFAAPLRDLASKQHDLNDILTDQATARGLVVEMEAVGPDGQAVQGRPPLRVKGDGISGVALGSGPSLSDAIVLVPEAKVGLAPEWSLRIEGRMDKLSRSELALLVGIGGYVPALARALEIDPTMLHVKVTMPDGHSGGFRLTKG